MNRIGAISRTFPKSFLTNVLIHARSPCVGQSLCVGARSYSSNHETESFEAFTERYVKFFDGVDDQFELKRGLNNCFAYDLVPAPSVIEASLRAARRVNDFSTAVRIFEGVKQKVENSSQYNLYLEELKPIKDELGILTKEELGF